MSAFMMPEKTTAIIATYLAEAAISAKYTNTFQGIRTIEPPESLIRVLMNEGCYDTKNGIYDASKIYEVLYKYNIEALKARYKKVEEAYAPFEAPTGLKTDEKSRREWLANLYTVARCYRYQISEGKVYKTEFYWAFDKWIDVMSYQLADIVVAEIRPPWNAKPFKGWDEF